MAGLLDGVGLQLHAHSNRHPLCPPPVQEVLFELAMRLLCTDWIPHKSAYFNPPTTSHSEIGD